MKAGGLHGGSCGRLGGSSQGSPRPEGTKAEVQEGPGQIEELGVSGRS